MIFGYLLLGHMLGDFVFQPRRLVAWKIRSKIGIAVHALIHFAITLLLFLPYFIHGGYSNLIVLTAAGISLLHFCIDAIKIKYELDKGKKASSFFIDQSCHFAVIIAAYYFLRGTTTYLPSYIGNGFYEFYFEPVFIIFLALTIFVTVGIEIYKFQQLRARDKNAKFQPHYGKLVIRYMLLILVYAILLFFNMDLWFSINLK